MSKVAFRSGSTVLIGVIVVLGCALGAPARPAIAQGAWYGEYFANLTLSGAPALTRYESELRFEWGTGSPGPGLPADGFSARWSGDMWFEGGTYRFSYRSDDGVRVWAGDVLAVDDWRDRQATWTTVESFIPRGTHRVRVEYYERVGGAAFQMVWEHVTGRAGWRAEYFARSKPDGSPTLVRRDAAIDFNWKDGSPDPSIPADNFSVRWSRTIEFTAGTYRFYSSSDDGVRIYVAGNNILDAWHDAHVSPPRSADVTLNSGRHSVVVEYRERGGLARAHVWWDRLGAFGGWQGRYYDNPEFRGGPAAIRDDAEINFDWGEGAPAAGISHDNFSIVWTRQVNFAPGYYRFNVRSDDGVRVWLDNGLIMDYWRPMDYEWHYADGFYLQGVRQLKVEYFERGGGARIRFWWESSGTPPSPAGLPAALPIAPTAPTAIQLGPWQGEYFSGGDLAGPPVLSRSDAALDFNWGWGAPAAPMVGDNFSARWTGSFHFEAGRYTFTTYSDDGVRLYVDGRRVIDSWRPMRGYRSASLDLTQGTHTMRVEYFERGGVALIRLSCKQTLKAALAQAPAAVPLPAPTQVPQPTPCPGGPLRLDAWPVGTACPSGGGWTATVFVQGHGGDCRYTYAWEGKPQGSPTSSSMTFEVRSASRGIAIVGVSSVASAGQTARMGLYIQPPADCR